MTYRSKDPAALRYSGNESRSESPEILRLVVGWTLIICIATLVASADPNTPGTVPWTVAWIFLLPSLIAVSLGIHGNNGTRKKIAVFNLFHAFVWFAFLVGSRMTTGYGIFHVCRFKDQICRAGDFVELELVAGSIFLISVVHFIILAIHQQRQRKSEATESQIITPSIPPSLTIKA